MKAPGIGIRADGSCQIGMGHLVRCMSVAEALTAKNASVVFITKYKESREFLKEKGFECILLSEQYETMEAELEETSALVASLGIKLLLVDSYDASGLYLEHIGRLTNVFYMDDFGRMDLPVRGIINYNIYGPKMDYRKYYGPETILLLGADYAPVREAFSGQNYQVRPAVNKIMITMGGSDSYNIGGRLVGLLQGELPEDIAITLICGKFNPHLEGLKKLAASEPRLTVLVNVPDMWRVMAESDLVITAAGSTMYELCAVGVPSICLYYAGNQKMGAVAFAEQLSQPEPVDYASEPQRALGQVTELTKHYINDVQIRRNVSLKMRALCDGKGTERIAQKLVDFVKQL